MMTENCLTLIDQLANEIILDIFDYLSTNDIIYGFFNLNQRFNSIVLYHQQILKYIETPTIDLYYWENIFEIFGSSIEHLIITTNDFSFSLNLFPNIKSLKISSLFPIKCEQFYSILKDNKFNQLISFKIHSQIYYIERYHQFWAEPIWKNLLNNQNSLEIFEYLSYNLPLSYLNTNSKLNINLNIHSLSLKIVHLVDIFPLLNLTPNIKYLNLIIVSPSFHQISFENKKFSKIKLEKFSLTSSEKRKFLLDEESCINLIYFIRQFSLSLNCLILNLTGYIICQTDTFYINGIFLQEQLLKFLIKLKTFHLYIELNQPPIDIENFLMTFQNSFWFNHHWSIGIHGKYIYTLPFYFKQFDEFLDFDSIQTSYPIIYNSSTKIWSNIRSLDLSLECKLNLNLVKQLKLQMPNLISMNFTSMLNQHPKDKNDKIQITLDSVNTIHLTGDSHRNYQKWLSSILPNLKHLILTDSKDFDQIIYENIQRLTINNRSFIFQSKIPIDTYFPNVKHMEMNIGEYKTDDAIRILNKFQNFQTLILYFSLNRYSISDPVDKILIEMFGENGLYETLQNYHIKYGYNCLQLIKKKSEFI